MLQILADKSSQNNWTFIGENGEPHSKTLRSKHLHTAGDAVYWVCVTGSFWKSTAL